MIVYLFLQGVWLVLLVITSPLRLLADATLPAGIASAVASANPYVAPLNVFAPIDVLIEVTSAVLVVETAVLSWKIINWVIRKIPGLK